MRRSFSNRPIPALLLAAAIIPAPVLAQAQEARGQIVSSEIALSRDAADLRLELADGRQVNIRLADDQSVRVNDERVGAYERRGALDQAWRELLQQAMDAPTGELATMLAAWQPPAQAGAAGTRILEQLAGLEAPVPPAAAPQEVPSDASDTIQRLNQRILELERVLQDPDAAARADDLGALDIPALRDLRRSLEQDLRQQIRQEMRSEMRREARQRPPSPFRHITRGLTGIFSTLMAYAVLVGLGFLAVFFGRSHLETIADTARHSTLRSGLVGLAGSFLVLPVFILGILALAISIVGIPLLLVYLPLFPLAVVLAAVGGYLAVAHGAGEALAERRFRGTEWFTRANSYYYVITGVGLLVVLFIAANVVTMAGPWLGFLQGLLKFMAVMVTWAAFMVGFGAFLLSRGGTRPTADVARPLEEEEIHV